MTILNKLRNKRQIIVRIVMRIMFHLFIVDTLCTLRMRLMAACCHFKLDTNKMKI